MGRPFLMAAQSIGWTTTFQGAGSAMIKADGSALRAVGSLPYARCGALVLRRRSRRE